MNREQAIRQCYLVPGWTWPTELGWLYDNISQSKSHAEIGTFCGRSLLASCAGMAPGASVLSVDDRSHWENAEWVSKAQAATLEIMTHVGFHVINAHSIDGLRYAAKNNMQFDSIFIDGDHNYAECRADIEGWQTLLKPGGLICGHDYWPRDAGVMDAVNELFEGRHSVVPGTRIWFHRAMS